MTDPTAICYIYANCDTCRKAKKWLSEHGHTVEFRPIRETPPSATELARMRDHLDGQVKKLFNTSSKDYRQAGLKDRIDHMSWTEIVQVLSENGNLVKRPFLLTAERGTVGFKPEHWATLFEPGH